MPNNLTDNEIIKALEECIELRFDDTEYATVKLDTLTNALDLINRLQEESKNKTSEIEELKIEINMFRGYDEEIKAEAYTEFAERLKEKSFETLRNYGLTKDVVEVCDIDNLVKEFERKENITYDD